MGEVLSFGLNLAVLDPSDRKGNDTYCIVAIEDKNMGFISYCLSLSIYIMSFCLDSVSGLVLMQNVFLIVALYKGMEGVPSLFDFTKRRRAKRKV